MPGHRAVGSTAARRAVLLHKHANGGSPKNCTELCCTVCGCWAWLTLWRTGREAYFADSAPERPERPERPPLPAAEPETIEAPAAAPQEAIERA